MRQLSHLLRWGHGQPGHHRVPGAGLTAGPRLRRVAGETTIPTGYQRVGLDRLLAGRGRRAGFAAVPGAAAIGGSGIRWPRAEQRDRDWWPQGIDVRRGPRGPVIAVSWHRTVDGADTAARVTFIGLWDGGRPRFWHVPLVEFVHGVATPVAIHAGGLAWHGESLYAADTFGGLRSFDVRHILRGRPFLGAAHLLPQSARYVSDPREGERRMRYSFVSLENDPAGLRLVAGEYRAGTEDARLLRLPFGKDEATEGELHVPGIARMQGACVIGGTWFITTSEGRHHGDLWVGRPGDLVRHAGVLPPGPEDLAQEPGTRRLWSVTEHPGRRWVYAIDADRWTISSAG